MKTSWKGASACALTLAAALTGISHAQAAEPLIVNQRGEVRYVSGGVGDQEQRELLDLKPDYGLQITVAREADGAYLSGVHVTLQNAQGELVVDAVMRGPILLVDVPDGTYSLIASLPGWTTQHRRVEIGSGQQAMHLTMKQDQDDVAG